MTGQTEPHSTRQPYRGCPGSLDADGAGPSRQASGLDGGGAALLEAHGLVCGHRGRAVVGAIDLAVVPGTGLAILGDSGAGKSTLLLTLAGLLPPVAGEILVRGALHRSTRADEERLRRLVGWVPQDPREGVFGATVGEDVSFGPCCQGLARSEIEARVHEALDLCGILPLAARSPLELSLGELRRVALAGALASRPRVLLLDEPTAGLDARRRSGLRALFASLRFAGTALVLALHDLRDFPDWDGGVLALPSCGEMDAGQERENACGPMEGCAPIHPIFPPSTPDGSSAWTATRSRARARPVETPSPFPSAPD